MAGENVARPKADSETGPTYRRIISGVRRRWMFRRMGSLCEFLGDKLRRLQSSEWARHRGDVGVSTGFVSGSGKFEAGPVNRSYNEGQI
ncbi:unnamed protein product [Prunus armeniaca]